MVREPQVPHPEAGSRERIVAELVRKDLRDRGARTGGRAAAEASGVAWNPQVAHRRALVLGAGADGPYRDQEDPEGVRRVACAEAAGPCALEEVPGVLTAAVHGEEGTVQDREDQGAQVRADLAGVAGVHAVVRCLDEGEEASCQAAEYLRNR